MVLLPVRILVVVLGIRLILLSIFRPPLLV
jgi:hypothetical protein